MEIDSFVASLLRFGRGAGGDSVVAWEGEVAYGLSYDRTVLVRAITDVVRVGEVVFRATDYEGSEVKMEGDRVTFYPGSGVKVRVQRPAFSWKGLHGLYERLWSEEGPGVSLSRSDLKLLDESLPHVELVWDGSQIKLLQRDIYTGKVVEILKGRSGEARAKMAIRTGDFWALMGMGLLWDIRAADGYFCASTVGVRAILGGCVYDDLGDLGVV